jgi:hypothetical protein
MQNLELESKIQKLEDEIKQLRTELSIAIEFYAEVYELINKLNHVLKTKQVEKHDLTELEGFSLLEYENQTSPTKRKSKIDDELDRVVNLIFKDYDEQFKNK